VCAQQTHVLLTHMPPLNVLDLAWVRTRDERPCELCGRTHPRYRHWGSQTLLDRIKVRPFLPCTCCAGDFVATPPLLLFPCTSLR
jgi:hypothetical protein